MPSLAGSTDPDRWQLATLADGWEAGAAEDVAIGDVDFAGTRGNSAPFDGFFWLEQVRTEEPRPSFDRAREHDSEEMPL